MVDDAHLIGAADIVAAWRHHCRRFRLRCQIVLEADARTRKRLWRQALAQLDSQRLIELRHAALDELHARIPADRRPRHVSTARLELHIKHRKIGNFQSLANSSFVKPAGHKPVLSSGASYKWKGPRV